MKKCFAGIRLMSAMLGVALVSSSAFAATTYNMTVTPSVTTLNVGGCLTFSGTVTLNGKPASGVSIGVNDPMKQQCIANAAKTDSNGKFTYTPENMCPAVNNDMVGVFQFAFTAGSTTVNSSKITVNTTSPTGPSAFSAVNSGTSTYKIKMVVNNTDKGTITVAPGKTVNLFSDSSFGNSTVVATILDASNKQLWKATYTGTRTVTPQTSTLLNPYYNNYWVNSTIALNGTTKSRTLNGIGQVYTDYVNQQWTVAGTKVAVNNSVTHGVAQEAALQANFLSCKTYLGLKAQCSVSVGASVGLQLCLGSISAVGVAIGPVKVGATASCCVEVASAKCNVLDASASLSSTYKP